MLVVDDEASIRDLLSKTLALAEHDVDVALTDDRPRTHAYVSVRPADRRSQDAGMDGLAVIREAKRYKADLPVIITGLPNRAPSKL